MRYKRIDIELPHEYTEELSDLLIVGGFDFFETYDYKDLEESAGEMFYDYIDDKLVEMKNGPVLMRLYFSDDDDGAANCEKVKKIVSRLECDTKVATCVVDSESWENNWKDFFHMFPVGKRLLVSPTWETPGADDLAGRELINIDPGGAFGSGTHVTTRLCLGYVEKYHDGCVLDMGCGSGILGIAAAKLGARHVDAVDIDKTAAKIAGENFEINRVDPSLYTVYAGDVISDADLAASLRGDYDVICANIVAGIIIAMAPFFASKLKSGGTLVTSGILVERKAEVCGELSKHGLECTGSVDDEGWTSVTFTKR